MGATHPPTRLCYPTFIEFPPRSGISDRRQTTVHRRLHLRIAPTRVVCPIHFCYRLARNLEPTGVVEPPIDRYERPVFR